MRTVQIKRTGECRRKGGGRVFCKQIGIAMTDFTVINFSLGLLCSRKGGNASDPNLHTGLTVFLSPHFLDPQPLYVWTQIPHYLATISS